jgi:hypothetical protein
MINVLEDKMPAIKALRDYIAETFGVTADLKSCIDFVEQLQNDARDVKKRQFRAAAIELAKYTAFDVIYGILDDVGAIVREQDRTNYNRES